MQRTSLLTIFLIIVNGTLFNVFCGQTDVGSEVTISKCWSYDTGDLTATAITSDANHIFAGLNGANIIALSSDGKKVWSSELGGELTSNLLTTENGLLLVTSPTAGITGTATNGQIRSISRETGVTSWTATLPESHIYYLYGFNGSVIVVSDGGGVESIDARSGSVKWKRDLSEKFVAAPYFTGESVSVAATGNQIFSISLATGEVEMMKKVPLTVTALGKTPSGAIAAGDDHGNLSLIPNGSDKAYWKFKSGGEVSSVIPIGDNLLMSSHDNFVYLLAGRNGGLEWKRRLASRLGYLHIVMEKFALISSFEEHGAVLIDLANGKVVGQIALESDEKFTARTTNFNGMVFAATNRAVYGYSLGKCTPDKLKATP